MGTEQKVGARIKAYREKLEMSRADLAAKTGIDEKVIAAIEDDDVIPVVSVLMKISRTLGQRLGTFMDDQYKPDPIIFNAALAAHGVKARECVYVDDYRPEADGARDLGFTSFLIDRKGTEKGEWVIDSLRKIVEWLDGNT